MKVLPRSMAAALLVAAALGPVAAKAALAQSTAYPPAPTTWFVDHAGLVSAAARQSIDGRLQSLEETSGMRVVIYTDRRLPAGESLEAFTLGSVESWKVWRRDQPAIALFIFSESRKIRLEVGYGAEAAVTDLEARRIIDEQLAPAFRRGDFEAGIRAAVEALGQAVAGELPPPKKRPRRRERDVSWPVIVFLIVMWLFVLPWLARRRRGQHVRGRLGPWIFGGPSSGGWGGGSSGGGGSIFGGGGGFSGGGGSFGGGGASGGW